MIDAIKSELRKLFTVRSTYFIILMCLVIIALFAGYGDGFKIAKTSLHDPNWLVHESYSAITFAGLIAAFAGLLMFGHEYRYTSIMYTLTSSNSRLKSLVAKVLVVSKFALVMSIVFTFFAPLCAIVGIHLAGYSLTPQNFDVWQVLWRCMFVGWGYAMYAFVLVAIIRSQIGAIVAFLLVPLIGENIIGGIFKSTAKYLPFSSLQAVVPVMPAPGTASLQHNIVVSLSYIAAGLVVSAVLFARRDAN
jgi:ABC-type transport system involved in multi-copper enzyme maturation permease subunit